MYKVYIVDDDMVILDEIVRAVPWLDNGFEVVGYTTSPILAIEDIKRMRPDVIFTDLKMPGMDGIELMDRVSKIEPSIECEYILLSAYASFEDSRRFFRLRGFDYLLKPIEKNEFQLVLERILAKLLAKQVQETSREIEYKEMGKISPAFMNLVCYIEKHYNQKHTLESLSKRFNLSPNYICNLFAKNYNTTLTRYITKFRMEQALVNMCDKNKTFKEIAVECGYTDYYYFCKVFKDYYGMPPTTYMRLHVNDDKH